MADFSYLVQVPSSQSSTIPWWWPAVVLLVATLIVGYYVLLTKSLARACRENRTGWVISLIISYFITIFGIIVLVIYMVTGKPKSEKKQGVGFNLGKHVLYALKKQAITAFMLLATAVITLVTGTFVVKAELPSLVSATLIFWYGFLYSMLPFVVIYTFKLLYLAKASKPKKLLAKVLSILSEYVKWYVLLLFAAEAFKLAQLAELSYFISGNVRLMALLFSIAIGLSYKE